LLNVSITIISIISFYYLLQEDDPRLNISYEKVDELDGPVWYGNLTLENINHVDAGEVFTCAYKANLTKEQTIHLVITGM